MAEAIPLIIDNKEVQTSETYAVTNPRDGEGLWNVYAGEISEANAAIESAQAAFQSWKDLSYITRRDLLNKAADKLVEVQEELRLVVQKETAAGEGWASWDINAAISIFREVAGRVSSLNGDLPPTINTNDTALVYKVPYGVILVIAPWNAPVVLAGRAIAYALAAGNTVVLKSSELSPRSHYILVDAFRRAGFPPGAVNLMTHAPDKGAQVVPALVQHPSVRKVSFTGSSATGRIIARLAGGALKPTLLELGGQAPSIVLDDAELKKAALGILGGAYGHAGQICMATERVIVLKSIEEPFIAALKAAHEELISDKHNLQPAIHKPGAEKVKLLVDNAIEQGAKVISGPADFADKEARVFGPTILSHVEKNSDLYYTESFGPLISLFVVDTIEEAISIANDTDYGLAASVWSKDIGAALRVAKKLDSGTVQINDSTNYDEPTVPHGGFGSSGFGRFGGGWGLSEFLTTKYIRFSL